MARSQGRETSRGLPVALGSAHPLRRGRHWKVVRLGSVVTALVMLGCAFGAALLGMYLRPRLPQQHLHDEPRDVVKLIMGLVATMAALVLGLLVASANASYERQPQELRELSTDVVLLDRTRALYGPDAQKLR